MPFWRNSPNCLSLLTSVLSHSTVRVSVSSESGLWCRGWKYVPAIFSIYDFSPRKKEKIITTNRRLGRQDSWQQCSFWTTQDLNSQLLEPKTGIYHSELIGKWQLNRGLTNWVSHSLLCRQIWNHCEKFSYQHKTLKIHILQHGDVGNLFLKMIDLLHKWITDV